MKLVENSKDYYVTPEGDVYRNGKKFRKHKSSNIYHSVVISFKDGTSKRLYVHRLVAELYIPNPDNKPVVNHKNSDRSDNRVENLEWCTYQENYVHAHKSGAFLLDGLHHHAIYSIEQIINVCKLLAECRRNIDIQNITGVDKNVVAQIRSRKTWNHISKDYNFPKKVRGISDSTIRWVCNKILEGFSNVEISKLSNGKLTRQKVNQIRNKKIYTDISKDYF